MIPGQWACLDTVRMEGLDVGVGDAKSSTKKLKITNLFKRILLIKIIYMLN